MTLAASATLDEEAASGILKIDGKIRKLTNRVESREKLTNRVQNLENTVKKKVRKMNIFLVKHSKIFYITNSSMLEHNYQKLIREEKTASLATESMDSM